MGDLDIQENFKRIKEDIENIFKNQLPKIEAANNPISSLKANKAIEDPNDDLSISL